MENTEHISISKEPLSLDECYAFIRDDGCGGNVLFIGTVRDHFDGKRVTKLEFEVYKSMAIKELSRIIESCKTRWQVEKIAIHHRYGELLIGDIAVIIAVSTPHRKEAFEASEYLIDELKKTVPIWKKEFLEDGSYWVGAQSQENKTR